MKIDSEKLKEYILKEKEKMQEKYKKLIHRKLFKNKLFETTLLYTTGYINKLLQKIKELEEGVK